MATVPHLDGSLAQLQADHRRLSEELKSTAPGTDDYGRLQSQLTNVARSITAAQNRLRGGNGMTRLL